VSSSYVLNDLVAMNGATPLLCP